MKSFGLTLFVWLFSTATTSQAFTTTTYTCPPSSAARMKPLFFQPQSDYSSNRRDALLSAAIPAILVLFPNTANAKSSNTPRIDVNNALAREYTAFPGELGGMPLSLSFENPLTHTSILSNLTFSLLLTYCICTVLVKCT